jgi:hypothetical protein
MATKSPYSGYTTRYGERYKNKRIGQCSDCKGEFICPSCKKVANGSFFGETVQLGFHYHKFMEFHECKECSYKFCLVMVRSEDRYDD